MLNFFVSSAMIMWIDVFLIRFILDKYFSSMLVVAPDSIKAKLQKNFQGL